MTVCFTIFVLSVFSPPALQCCSEMRWCFYWRWTQGLNSQGSVLVKSSHSTVLDGAADLLGDLFSCVVNLFSKYSPVAEHALHHSQPQMKRPRYQELLLKIPSTLQFFFFTIITGNSCLCVHIFTHTHHLVCMWWIVVHGQCGHYTWTPMNIISFSWRWPAS